MRAPDPRPKWLVQLEQLGYLTELLIEEAERYQVKTVHLKSGDRVVYDVRLHIGGRTIWSGMLQQGYANVPAQLRSDVAPMYGEQLRLELVDGAWRAQVFIGERMAFTFTVAQPDDPNGYQQVPFVFDNRDYLIEIRIRYSTAGGQYRDPYEVRA
jgi:hypothetical protein